MILPTLGRISSSKSRAEKSKQKQRQNVHLNHKHLFNMEKIENYPDCRHLSSTTIIG
jgi:hypothetical protein